MNRPTSNDPDLDALLGAYALDALDDDERARVDEYLATNPAALAVEGVAAGWLAKAHF